MDNENWRTPTINNCGAATDNGGSSSSSNNVIINGKIMAIDMVLVQAIGQIMEQKMDDRMDILLGHLSTLDRKLYYIETKLDNLMMEIGDGGQMAPMGRGGWKPPTYRGRGGRKGGGGGGGGRPSWDNGHYQMMGRHGGGAGLLGPYNERGADDQCQQQQNGMDGLEISDQLMPSTLRFLFNQFSSTEDPNGHVDGSNDNSIRAFQQQTTYSAGIAYTNTKKNANLPKYLTGANCTPQQDHYPLGNHQNGKPTATFWGRKNYGNEQKPPQNGIGGNGSGGGGIGNGNGLGLDGGFGAVSRQPTGARSMFMKAVAAATSANGGQKQTLGKAGINKNSEWTTKCGRYTDSESSDDNDDENKEENKEGNKDDKDDDVDKEGKQKAVEMDENGKEEKNEMATNEQKLIGEGKKGEVKAKGKAKEVETAGKEEKDENPQQQNGRRNSI